MVVEAEQERVRRLLREALPILCKTGLQYSSQFSVDALIGVTLDNSDVFLISIKETFTSGDAGSAEKAVRVNTASDSEEGISRHKKRLRKRKQFKAPTSGTEMENNVSDFEEKAVSVTTVSDSEEGISRHKKRLRKRKRSKAPTSEKAVNLTTVSDSEEGISRYKKRLRKRKQSKAPTSSTEIENNDSDFEDQSRIKREKMSVPSAAAPSVSTRTLNNTATAHAHDDVNNVTTAHAHDDDPMALIVVKPDPDEELHNIQVTRVHSTRQVPSTHQDLATPGTSYAEPVSLVVFAEDCALPPGLLPDAENTTHTVTSKERVLENSATGPAQSDSLESVLENSSTGPAQSDSLESVLENSSTGPAQSDSLESVLENSSTGPALCDLLDSVLENLATGGAQSDEENEETLIYDDNIDRVYDINNSQIFCRRVLKSAYTKSGSERKKTNRVYNSKQACPFGCESLQTNFATHVLSMRHRNEPEAKRIRESRSLVRKNRLELLRLKANHEHNIKVLTNREGQILLGRRNHAMTGFNLEDWVPCPWCNEWLFVGSIRKHFQRCVAKEGRTDRPTVGEMKMQAKVFSGRLKANPSKLLITEVLPIMRADAIGLVAQSDALIVGLGNEWMERHVANRVNRKHYTCAIMRLVARVKMALNDGKDHPKDFKEFLSPKYFIKVCKAVMTTAAQDEADDQSFEAPPNAVRLKYDLTRLANIKLAEAIIHCNAQDEAEAQAFLQLIKTKWSHNLATVALLTRKLNVRKDVPLAEDVMKLCAYLNSQMERFNHQDVSYANYKRAITLTMAKLISFNGGRCGAVQATLMVSYNERIQDTDDISEELMAQLTDVEKLLLETRQTHIIENANHVPIIVPPLSRRLLEYITDNRVEVGVRDNLYLFANRTTGGVMRAYSALKTVTRKAGLKYPDRITSSNCPKYFATLTQSCDLAHQQLNHVLNDLEQTMNAHKVHYRHLSPAVDRLDVAKLLLVEDLGLMDRYTGQSTDDIRLQDVVDIERQRRMEEIDEELGMDDDIDMDDVELQTEPRRQPPPVLDDDDYMPDLAEAEVEQEMEQHFMVSEEPQMPGRTKSSRLYMSVDENIEVKTIFKSFIEEGRTPSMYEVEKGLQQSRQNGGTIHKYNSRKIIKKISWWNNRSRHMKQ